MENLYDLEGKGFVSIWVGDFDSIEKFDEYLEEKIGDEADSSAPINKFSSDFGIGFYDHDFQEADFFGEKMSISDLLTPFSYSDSFLVNAVKASIDSGITESNTAILLFDYNFAVKKMDTFAPIKFIGSFHYQKN